MDGLNGQNDEKTLTEQGGLGQVLPANRNGSTSVVFNSLTTGMARVAQTIHYPLGLACKSSTVATAKRENKQQSGKV